MNITLKQIETFVWLAALKNFRRVAEQMNTTQPNISSRISSFEEALNLRLFERDAGSVVLTDQGQSVLPLAERTLQAVQALLQAGDTTREQAVLRLGVAETVAQTWLHRFLKEISRRLPNVIVELTVDLTVNLQRNLLERTLDLAFLNGPISELSVTILPLGTVPLLWVRRTPDRGQNPGGSEGRRFVRFSHLDACEEHAALHGGRRVFPKKRRSTQSSDLLQQPCGLPQSRSRWAWDRDSSSAVGSTFPRLGRPRHPKMRVGSVADELHRLVCHVAAAPGRRDRGSSRN
ncbi:MAG: LysR family transcriptional regulator [Hyphomicrobiales bacterium]|nr:LysR family transcriptional regulator [Hyphomicrobiales bacterium]